MLPKDSNSIVDFEIITQPSKTYSIVDGSICDGLEAVKQTIELILNTERYKYTIYSWNYGIELNDLFGQPKSYVIPELQRRITEALTQDDRVKSVDNFEFEVNKKIVSVSFTANTIYGEVNSEKEVSI